MMIKSTKKSKRLAMLVGAALSFGVAYGMMPGDALAADYNIFYTPADTDNGIPAKWDFNVDGSPDSSLTIDDVLAAFNMAGNTFTTMNNDGSGNNSWDTREALMDAIAAKGGVTLAAGNTVTINISHSQATLTAGADPVNISLIKNDAGDYVVKADGGTYTFNQKKDYVNTIDIAAGSTLDEVVLDESANGTGVPAELKASGATIDKVTVKGSSTLDVSQTTDATIGTLDLSASGSKLVVGNNGDALANQNIGTIKVDDPDTQFVQDDGTTTGVTSVTLNENTTLDASANGLGSLTNVTAGAVELGNNNITVDDGTGGGVKLDADSVTTTGNITVNDAAGLKDGANVTAGDFVVADADTANNIKLDNLDVSGTLNIPNTGATVQAGTVTIGDSASVTANSAITADKVVLGTDGAGNLTNTDVAGGNLVVTSPSGGAVTVELTGMTGAEDIDTLKNTVATALGVAPNDVKIIDKDTQDALLGNVDSDVADANAALDSLSDLMQPGTVEKVANADPFLTRLPSAADLDSLAANTSDAVAIAAAKSKLESARDQLQAAIASGSMDNDVLNAKLAEVNSQLAAMPTSAADQAAKIREAVRNGSGRTAAAPGATSARTAAAITTVLTDNVVNRNAEIRDFEAAAAVDDGRPAPDRVWFQYKHTNMDVDGDIYNESNVNTNTFQLGYDAKVGNNDYLGVFVGTTTGDAEFNGPTRSGSMDIDGSFDIGVYGTHLLPKDQYIDYMIHTGSFDSKYAGDKWGTMDTGAMVGYGVKVASSDRLTLNPYVQLAYDKISVDDYVTGAGGNRVASDDSNNWTAKLGMNIIDASGLYGGFAYSRGLSGSYNAYVNGIPMPTSDYNANVLYLSLGYRANMSKNAVLDLSMEKTFMDYDGWTASGKVNFYF